MASGSSFKGVRPAVWITGPVYYAFSSNGYDGTVPDGYVICQSQFRLSVPPPPAPAPQSWSELGAAARSFAAYAQDTCDSVSVRLAITLVDFIAEVEEGGQLVEGDPSVLVWWINDGLEEYRNAVGRDIDSGGNSRIALIDQFSASNPELQGLVLSVLRERLLDGACSQPKAGSVKPRLQERFHAERKISKEVIECIPTRVSIFCQKKGAAQRTQVCARFEIACTSGRRRFHQRSAFTSRRSSVVSE